MWSRGNTFLYCVWFRPNKKHTELYLIFLGNHISMEINFKSHFSLFDSLLKKEMEGRV